MDDSDNSTHGDLSVSDLGDMSSNERLVRMDSQLPRSIDLELIRELLGHTEPTRKD